MTENPFGLTEAQLLSQVRDHLYPANTNRIRCVDERQLLDNTNGVEIQGGTFGIVDALKAVLQITEDQAWDIITRNQFPLGAHVDDRHGEAGCGYAKLVQTSPATVFAPEAVPASQRLERVRNLGGEVIIYTGEHDPQIAVVNLKRGYSLDPDQAPNLGAFSLDLWAMDVYAKELSLASSKNEQIRSHILRSYKATVTALTGMTRFYEIR